MLGLPGSGKTTAAAEIARQTGAVHISSDAFRLAQFNPPQFTQAEHDILYRTLDYVTELLLTKGMQVIYDANVNRYAHRKDKYDICQKIDADCTLLWVQTQTEVARSRRIDESHALLVPPYETAADMFDRIASIFESPDSTAEPYTILDGTQITAEYIRQRLGIT